MSKFFKIILIGLMLGCSVSISAQHAEDKVYFWPKDSLVKEKLAWWQDQKFGLLMHWGAYSQWGIVESWSICPEDEDWCKRRGPYSSDYFEYLKAYENLGKTFNPVKFNPRRWAEAAANAGMKYMVFTTKHHDGFCMFDTKQTDYKITGPDSPFAGNPRADVTTHIFNAFREKGMGIGAYFSKPDWHCPDYWDPYFPPLDRHPNYDPRLYPDKWEKYKQFTHAQIRELLSGYGKVDILWLDGGWVRQRAESVSAEGKRLPDQNIDMPALAAMARELQPGILVGDRAVEGPYQDYLTPEQRIPQNPLDFPWETCMTMASSWSYVPGDKYKSSRELIHLLCKIVSRGGNLLLNIGPGPDGEWAPEAYERLEDIGNWMKINSEAIYKTKPLAPYEEGNLVYTTTGNRVFAICLLNDKDSLPETISVSLPQGTVAKIDVPGNNKALKYKVKDGKAVITLTEELRNKSKAAYAVVFRISLK